MKSLDKQTKQLKRFKTIEPNSGKIVSAEFYPLEPSHTNATVVGILSMLIANASGQPNLTPVQSSMLIIALHANQVTIQEAMESFWRAYGDPYVSGGRIEFRHMMKYISESREINKSEYYSYVRVLEMVDKKKASFTDFTCLNGEDNKELKLGRDGKPLWLFKATDK